MRYSKYWGRGIVFAAAMFLAAMGMARRFLLESRGKFLLACAVWVAMAAASPVAGDDFSGYLAPFKYGKPILAPSGEEGAFDQLAVDHPKIFEHDGRFYLSYLGYDGTSYQTGLAVSGDLLHWEKIGIVFRRGDSTNEWDRLGRVVSGYLKTPEFGQTPKLVAKDGYYWLMYHAYPGKGYEEGAAANGLAYASSPTSLVWHACAKPVLTQTEEPGKWDSGGLYSAAPFVKDGRYFCYYTAKENLSWPWHEQVGLAEAADSTLACWKRYGGNPVCRVGSCRFDSLFTGGADVMWDSGNGKYVRYFMGFDGKHARAGVGISDDGINWRSFGEPVIDVGGPGSIDETHAHKIASAWYKGDLYLIYCAVRPLHTDEERAMFKKKGWNEYRCLTVARSRPF